MTKYRNIIFDLGGVILNIDYQLTIDAFTALGIEDFDAMYTQAAQSDLFDLIETGKCSEQAFRDGLLQFLPAGTTNQQIDDAWNALLLDLPAARLELLRSLANNHRLFLLSNTNSIHYREYAKNLELEHGLKSLGSLFEKAYYSFEVGMRKPDLEIFEHVLSDAGLKPEETLFIDDSKQHIEGAKKAGIHAHWLTNGETIIDLFAEQS